MSASSDIFKRQYRRARARKAVAKRDGFFFFLGGRMLVGESNAALCFSIWLAAVPHIRRYELRKLLNVFEDRRLILKYTEQQKKLPA